MSVPSAYVGIILIWSTTPLAIKWSGEGPGYLFGVTGRMVIGVVLCMLLVSLLSVRMPWHKRAVHTYIAAGLAVYGAMITVYWGAQFIPSGLVSVIFGLTPFITGIAAALLLREKSFTPSRILAMLLGFCGLYIIFQSSITLGDQAVFGICAVLLSVCIHSISTVWVKAVGAKLPSLVVTNGALLVSTPLYLVTWWVFDGELPENLPEKSLLSILYLGIFGSVLGFILYYYSLKRLQAGTMALITLITPVTALVLGSQINHEKLDVYIWAGALSVIFALLVYQWGDHAGRLLLSRVRYSGETEKNAQNKTDKIL